MFDHSTIKQNEVLASGFSKAQSLAASAGDVSKRSSTNSLMPNQLRANRDSDDLPEESSYFTMVLSVNGYDVTVPILTDDATNFCKTVSNEFESSASPTQASTNADEPTEAPVDTHTSEAKHTSGDREPKPTTAPEYTNNTAPDTARMTVEPTKTTMESHGLEITSTNSASEGTTPASQSPPEDPPTSSSAKNGRSSIITTGTDDNPTLDHTFASRSTYISVAEDTPTPDPSIESSISNKHTITLDATTATTDDTLMITTMSSSDDPGKSRDASQDLAENSEAWASYYSYIDDLHSRLSEQLPDNSIDTPTSTEGQTATEALTPNADKPAKTGSKIAIRQQQQASQAAGMRNILPWFRTPFVWRRNGYHLHNSSEIEQVQGFSYKTILKSSKNKRRSPHVPVHDPLTGEEGLLSQFMAQEEPTPTTENTMTVTTVGNDKPTFGFDPHPHPRPPSTEDKPLPSFTLHTTKTPTRTSTTPDSAPELGDITDIPSPSHSSPVPSVTVPGNATHTGPGNITQPTEPSSGAFRHWPKNPFAASMFWGTGLWYLLMAYWEGWQQARGEFEWGWTDGMYRWVGREIVRYL
ncbi:hypothetical protein SLS60_001310 [Paraconiothyrium brasiliense]|uniref:Uncharacterized protein n=1 Tax=Paraconiothyrium brasiliense TaxID=300254 RepID=A0ABR3S9I0_9PLEO